jgi:hypothetical protein
VVVYGPFSLCVIHKEGLCPSSGGINRLMMMAVIRHFITYIHLSHILSHTGIILFQGDSGGPIQVQMPLPHDNSASMYYVVGVTSFGTKCAKPNEPGVYTNVTNFLCWIEKNVWPEEPNTLCLGDTVV